MDETIERELRDQVEAGQKAKIVREVLGEFLLRQRSILIIGLESNSVDMTDISLRVHGLYLTLLRKFEQTVETFITKGEIAEEELINGGQ